MPQEENRGWNPCLPLVVNALPLGQQWFQENEQALSLSTLVNSECTQKSISIIRGFPTRMVFTDYISL